MRSNATRGLLSAPSRTYTPAPPKPNRRLSSNTRVRLEPLDMPQQQTTNGRFRTRTRDSASPRTTFPPTSNNGLCRTNNGVNSHHLPSDTKPTGGEKCNSARQAPLLSAATRATPHVHAIKAPSMGSAPRGTGVQRSSGKTTEKEHPREPRRPVRQRLQTRLNTSITSQPPLKSLNRATPSGQSTRAPVNTISNPEDDSALITRGIGESNVTDSQRQETGVSLQSLSHLATSLDTMRTNQGAWPLGMLEHKTKKTVSATPAMKRSTSPPQQLNANTDANVKIGDSGSSVPLVPPADGLEDDYRNTSNWLTRAEMFDETACVIEGICLEPPFSTHLWTQAYTNPGEMVSQFVGTGGAVLGSEGAVNVLPKGASALHRYSKQLKDGYYACIRCGNPVCSPQYQIPAEDLQNSRTRGYAVFSRVHANGLRVEITNIGAGNHKKTSLAQAKDKIQHLEPNKPLTFSVFCRCCNGCVGVLESAEGRSSTNMRGSHESEQGTVCEWFLANSLCLEYIPRNTRASLNELLASTSFEGNKKHRGEIRHIGHTNNCKPMYEEDEQTLTTSPASDSSSQCAMPDETNETDQLAKEWGLCLEGNISDEDIEL
ncbi:unnamed protein product [Phytomonas sp. EM1]|nr:unnamed protein product [Phytomonas sp. EM1]|eukprot:CCW62953.1 unnamed protein product [Phytomonas sp. isolate EM1]